MKRTRLAAGAVVATIVLALVGWAVWPRAAEAAYVTAPATRGSITQTISLVGPVERDGQAEVTYRSDGVVTAVHVRTGDPVAAGQQLVSIDPAPLRLAVLQAQAQVAQAEAQLDADLAAQRAGAGSPNAGLGGGLPGTGLPATGGAPSGGLPIGGLPGAGAPPAAPSGTPGAPGGAPPGYLLRMNTSLAGLQQAVVVQQQQCTPVFEALQQLRELQGSLPTALPTALPTVLPTALPSVPATTLPSSHPTAHPTILPTAHPTTLPTAHPTILPTAFPTAHPSVLPTAHPTLSPASPTIPTATPTPAPASVTPLPEPLPERAAPSAHPAAGTDPVPPELREGFARLVGMADQVQACSDAMVGLARAEGEAGQAIGEAVQGFAAQTQQAQVAIAQAQAELQQAMAAAQAQAEAAARAAAEAAIRQAQEQLAAQMAASFGGTVTDATIANDRARLLQARQQLDTAQADLSAATLTSPISGVVGAIDFAVGEGSAGRSAVVVGAGAARVTVDVPLSVRGLVTPGVRARVGQLAAPSSLDGQVTSVSVLPTRAGDPTYRTEVVADDPEQALRPGSWADVTLTLAQATDVLTVRSSAVTKITDTTATVEVVDAALDDTATTVTVVTGRTGGGKVEIVSGLVEGQIVVLADKRLPVPGGIEQYQPSRQGGASPTPVR